MEGMLPETEAGRSPASVARELADLLREHPGAEVAVLDLRGMNAWTDYFVIATAASETRLGGMERRVKEFCRGRDIPVLRRSRRPGPEGDEWRIIDLGTVVVHLMSERVRSFYELERLWAPPAAGRENTDT